METKIEKIVNWIKEETEKANANGVVIGISGGIDSAVVATLAKKAFPQNTLAIWMGIDSLKYARRNCNRVLLNLDLEETKIDLKPTLEQYIKDIFELEILGKKDLEAYTRKMNGEKLPRDMSYLELENYQEIIENIKTRLRITTLYAWAQRKNYLVLNTSNLSEIYVGYYKKWGDSVGDLAPIANLTRTEVYQLAKELELPKLIIETSPLVDSWDNKKSNKEEIEITYEDIDNFLANKEILEEKKVLIEKLHQENLHKLIGVKKID